MTSSFKQIKSANLGVALQLTELTGPGIDGRRWEVHDVERGRGFRVSLSARATRETPAGQKPLGRPFTEEEIEGAIGVAVERALTSGREKVPGPLYELDLTGADLYEYAQGHSVRS